MAPASASNATSRIAMHMGSITCTRPLVSTTKFQAQSVESALAAQQNGVDKPDESWIFAARDSVWDMNSFGLSP